MPLTDAGAMPSAAAISLVPAGSASALELEDHLEVVLDRRGQRLRRAHGGHTGGATVAERCGLSRGVRRSPRTSSTGTRDRWRTSFATLP